MRVAFATCAVLADGTEDDRVAAALLQAEFCVWDDPTVDWSAYDRVVVRSIWDYSWQLEPFLAWTRHIGSALRNAPEVIAFNADKRYLAELHSPTIPTDFIAPGDAFTPAEHEVVIKPNVSAGARDTGRFPATPSGHADAAMLVQAIHASGRIALVQPYMASVDRHGETSVVLFNGEVSHVLHKRPVLRGPGIAPPSREEMGVAEVMLDPELVSAGRASSEQYALARTVHEELVARFGREQILYARVDMISADDGTPLLGEVELIEPSLYLDTAPGAPERLAAAILAG